MALEQQRNDLANTIRDQEQRSNDQLDRAWHSLTDAYSALDYAMRGMTDQCQRTLVSTAYDIAVQARALTEQLMLLRGTTPTIQ